MKWEDFVTAKEKIVYRDAERVDIQCPKCGKDIWVKTNVILASYPPKRSYFCECGWSGQA